MFRQIRYFQAVVRCGSFTRAAEECYISQSAVSQQIQALEHTLGVELLRRENRRLILTPAGEHFYQKSLPLLEDLERLCRETREIGRGQRPPLRIGYLESYGGGELQQAVALFARQCPGVAVDITGGSHEDLFDLIRLGGADLVLSDQRRVFSDDYVNLVLAERPCVAEMAEHHPLAKEESLELSRLRGVPCILIATPACQEDEAVYYRDVLGFPSAFLFAGSLEEARLMAAGGKGLFLSDGGGSPALRRVPLLREGKPILLRYCAFWRVADDSPTIRAFAALLQSQFEGET